MKFSIVTISFNQGQFLEDAINSVLTQDYADVEYIVVDPGSTDGSRDIINRYRDRLSAVVLEPDSGPADGLNRGFKLATGEIFGFLNADDLLCPSALSQVASALAANQAIDVVSGHALVIDQDGKLLRRCFSERFSLLGAAYGTAILIQPSTFFRARNFRQIGGFNLTNRSNWDGELFVDMKVAGARFAVVNQFWSAYRLHGTSITSSKKLNRQIESYRHHIFRKIMRRDLAGRDKVIGFLLRIWKHLTNPRATIERIRFGPIYGRATTSAGN